MRFYFVARTPATAGATARYNQIWAHAHSTPVPGQPGLRSFTAH